MPRKDKSERSERRKNRAPPPSAFHPDGNASATSLADVDIDGTPATRVTTTTDVAATVAAPAPAPATAAAPATVGGRKLPFRRQDNPINVTSPRERAARPPPLMDTAHLDEEVAAEAAAAFSTISHRFSHGIRFPTWIATSVFSLVCLISIISKVHDFDQGFGAAQKWAMSVCIISLVVGLLSVLCYMFCRAAFMSQLPEMILVGCVVFTVTPCMVWFYPTFAQ
jgi:hypothetical protein